MTAYELWILVRIGAARVTREAGIVYNS